jgi:hypothetical protein
MNGALLHRCGAALYGERWQSPLARDLEVAVRTVQRWAAGSNPMPAGIWPQIYRLLRRRHIEIAALQRQLADDLGTDEPDHDGEAADAAA